MYIKPPKIIRTIFPSLIWEMPPSDEVYLTFDDGPTPGVTEEILEQLAKYDAKATFFCLGKNAEITRFKGLGEISADEFKDFIGPDMRLDQVKLRKEDSVKEMLEFYMGKNTMERQLFIVDNLVVEDNDNMDMTH